MRLSGGIVLLVQLILRVTFFQAIFSILYSTLLHIIRNFPVYFTCGCGDVEVINITKRMQCIVGSLYAVYTAASVVEHVQNCVLIATLENVVWYRL